MVLKYIFDRVCALLGLIVAMPLLLVVALLIRIKMPDGPILYTQKRVGKDGRLFTIYKFRTMRVGTDQSSVSVAGESRITPLGTTLRKYKIDELPELWNVLIGNMSFVGPRPREYRTQEQRRTISLLDICSRLRHRHIDDSVKGREQTGI